MGPWLSWESAAFATRRPRVRIPSGPPIKKEPNGSFFIGGDRGAHTFMQATGFTSDLTRWGNPQTVPPSHCPLPCGGASGGVLFGGFFIWRVLGNTDFPVRLCPFILPFRRQPAFTHQPDQIEDTPDAQLQAHGRPYAGQSPAGRGQPCQRDPDAPHGSQIE